MHKKRAKKQDPSSAKHQFVIKQILTLFSSGVYITNKELMDIFEKLGYESVGKDREILLKNLLAQAQHDNQIACVYEQLITLLQQRIQSYKTLTMQYPHINTISKIWIQKASTVVRLLQQEKMPNPYEL